MTSPLVYVAGPLFDEGERWWIETIEARIAAQGLSTFLPHRDNPDKTPDNTLEIFRNDRDAIDRCDLVVANADAKFGIPEAKRGLAAGAGGLIRLPEQVPSRIAMELALTGDFIDARRAYEIGLVNRVVDGPAIDGALTMASAISANGPIAVRVSKQIIVEARSWPACSLASRSSSPAAVVASMEAAMRPPSSSTMRAEHR